MSSQNKKTYLYRMVHIVDNPNDTAAGWLAAARGWRIRLCYRLLTSPSARPRAGPCGGAPIPHAVLLTVRRRLYSSTFIYHSNQLILPFTKEVKKRTMHHDIHVETKSHWNEKVVNWQYYVQVRYNIFLSQQRS